MYFSEEIEENNSFQITCLYVFQFSGTSRKSKHVMIFDEFGDYTPIQLGMITIH